MIRFIDIDPLDLLEVGKAQLTLIRRAEKLNLKIVPEESITRGIE